MYDRLKQAAGSTWPLLLLCIINFVTFAQQYEGHATFPWDFLGGYHAEAFGWYNNGGMLHPPSWFPWTNLGFPAFLALQSGAWYLPLGLMHLVGLPYTIHAATVFQVLHVLFGALGVYALTRRVGGSKVVALVAAIGYHFGATFYSNQEHVDVVRAVAWVPWLLFALHPRESTKSRWNVLIGALVLSQLLIAGYPGNIVAAAYACFAWVAFWAWDEPNATRRVRYLLGVTLIVVAGTMMAMPKWLPLFIHGSTGIRVENLPPAPFAPSHLLTLLAPYDVNVLPSDITMRSLWLPLSCIWGIVYASPRNKLTRIGLVFIGLALFMGMFVRSTADLSRIFPGMEVSRFPLSDWRPILQLGFILASVDGWTNLLSRKCTLTRALVGTIVAFGLGCGVVALAINVGFSIHDLFRVIVALVTMASLTVCFAIGSMNCTESVVLVIVFGILLIGFTAIDGYQYQMSQPATWRMGWSAAVGRQVFGVNVSSVIRSSGTIPEIARRPARLLVGTSVTTALAKRDSSFYNRCWYEHSYCVFGYDNLKRYAPHRMFLQAVAAPEGDALLDFVERPQQLLALAKVSSNVIAALTRYKGADDSPVIGDSSGISVAFDGYAPALIQYKISTSRDVQFVANETWWQGWKVSVCDGAHHCSPYFDTRSTPQGLRSWGLKKGVWTVRLRYFGPSLVPGVLCALVGLLLALCWPVFVTACKCHVLERS